MAEPREVRVKLTADVNEYIAAMKQAKQATRGLALGYWLPVGIAALSGVVIGSAITLLSVIPLV